ncbi:MAG: hypothetical protein NC930_01935 [Candidatus Omnitrophica bacterium]|nr:hypothetical protein [Candidatus Omnitrophota bacterium]
MNFEKEKIKKELAGRLARQVEEMWDTPTVTMTDIENVVSKLQRNIGKETTKSLLRLKNFGKVR